MTPRRAASTLVHLPGVPVFLIGAALAHVPHDTVRSVALGESAWWLLADPQGASLLLRSDDQGRTWTYVGGAVLADRPKVIAPGPGEGLLALGETALWSTTDGARWAGAALPGRVERMVAGPALLLGGPAGAWAGPSPWTQLSGDPVVATGQGPAYAGAEGAVGWWAEGWHEVQTGWSDLTAVSYSAGVVWAGRADGSVWWLDAAGWVPCADLPPAALGSEPAVVGVLAAGDDLFVTTGTLAPLVSDLTCAAWADRRTPAAVVYEGSGAAASAEDAWPVLATSGGRWLVGGWAGLFLSDDLGLTWTEAAVVPPDHTRGLVFAPDYADTGRVWIGSYGAGVGWTDDGGLSFVAGAHGLDDANVQRVVVPPDAAGDGRVYAVVGHTAWGSAEDGAQWTALPTGQESTTELVPFGDGLEVWAVGTTGDRTSIRTSTDAGATFGDLPGLEAAIGTLEPANAAEAEVKGGALTRCVTLTGDSGVACSGDDGATWAVVSSSADIAEASAPVFWPREAAQRVVWTDNEAVNVSRDFGRTMETTHPTGGDEPVALAGADDDTLLLATRTGAIWRSVDGGESWDDLGLHSPAWVSVLAPRPRFLEAPDVLLGTYDGIYLLRGVTSDTPTLERWSRWQPLDGGSSLWSCPLCGEVVTDAGAQMDTLVPLPEGGVLTAWLTATELTVALGAGSGELYVDGALVGEVGAGTTKFPGLATGTHDVALVATSSEGAWIDGLTGFAPGTALGPLGSPGGRRCGCETGGAPRFAWVVAWLVGRRRNAAMAPRTSQRESLLSADAHPQPAAPSAPEPFPVSLSALVSAVSPGSVSSVTTSSVSPVSAVSRPESPVSPGGASGASSVHSSNASR